MQVPVSIIQFWFIRLCNVDVLIQGYRGTEAFVATQWPLEDTVVDFWRLLKDHEVQQVVLLEQLSLKVRNTDTVL